MSKSVIIECGSDSIVIPVTDNIGNVLAALTSAKLAHKTYEVNIGYVYKLQDKAIELLFVDGSAFAEPSDVVTKLNEDITSANKAWNEQYTKAQALQKEVDELKTKLAALKTNVEEF